MTALRENPFEVILGEKVPCTYQGKDGYGPWEFIDDIDPWGPVLVCDLHGQHAQFVVYLFDPGEEQGPCHWYDEVDYKRWHP